MMHYRYRFLCLSAAAMILAAPAAFAETEKAPADALVIQTKEKPAHGADPDTANDVCKTGEMQSPIDISAYVPAALPAMATEYSPVLLRVANTGHGVQVDAPQGGTLTLDGKVYALQHYHFHTPSEHYIDGSPFPMEAHFVHKAEDGALAVIGVMMSLGAPNPVVQNIWDLIPETGQTKQSEAIKVAASELMPAESKLFHYQGSLTTPPCTEGVDWFVIKEPVKISREQLAAFQALYPHNARPVQDLKGRIVKGSE